MTRLGLGMVINGAGTVSDVAGPSRYTPTLTFSPVTSYTYGATTQFTLAAVTNSDGAVTYSSSDSTVISISGSTATVVGAGTASITASVAGTTSNYPVSKSVSVTIAKATPTISFSVINLTVGATYTLAASTTSDGLVSYSSSNSSIVSISGNIATCVAQGSATITASVAATNNNNARTATAVMYTAPATARAWTPYSSNGTGSYVWYAGNIYQCTVLNTGIVPTNASFWKLIAAGSPIIDTDVSTWFSAVQSVGSSITTANQYAINTFIQSLKDGGVWNAIQQSHILVGNSDLGGALVPIKGVSPTNNGFVSGDYSRTAGLVTTRGDRYLNLNRANNADASAASRHMYIGFTQAPTNAIAQYPLATGNGNGDARIGFLTDGTVQLSLSSSPTYIPAATVSAATSPLGIGMNHNGATSAVPFFNGNQTPVTGSIPTQNTGNWGLFATGIGQGKTIAKVGFYSIGDLVSDLTIIDSCVKTLFQSIS